MIVVLRLEGALQSWGEKAKWEVRDTTTMPTKSGIVGLLACCFGYKRGDPAIVDLYRRVRLAVRTEKPGSLLYDYHTVEGMPILYNAEGKPKSGGNTIVSKRYYLQDACFTGFLETDPLLAKEIQEALCNPKWVPFLGRKSCPPSKPIFVETMDEYYSLEDTAMNYPSEYTSGSSQILIDCDEGLVVRMDQISNVSKREFAQRRSKYLISTPRKEE
jgi:CRISPR system Cascade subunit CasD